MIIHLQNCYLETSGLSLEMLRQELAGCNALHRGGLGQLVVVASISTMQKHGRGSWEVAR